MDNVKVYTHAVIADIYYDDNGKRKRSDELYYCTSVEEAHHVGINWAMTGRTNVAVIDIESTNYNMESDCRALTVI